MKILYVTDIHGDKNKYEKVIELSKRESVDAVVSGGDILPKRGYRALIQKEFLQDYLPDYFKRLNEEGIEYFVMLGNDDLEKFDQSFDELCQKFPNVHNIAQSKFPLGDYEIIGMNYILDTPFPSKERVIYEDNFSSDFKILPEGIKYINGTHKLVGNWPEELKKLAKMKDVLNSLPEPEDMSKAIYVIHEPPANLNLGITGTTHYDVGSKDILNFIKDKKPRFTLHGHIHESPEVGGDYFKEVGETVCIQPGQTELNEEEMVYVLIDLDNKTFERSKEKVV